MRASFSHTATLAASEAAENSSKKDTSNRRACEPGNPSRKRNIRASSRHDTSVLLGSALRYSPSNNLFCSSTTEYNMEEIKGDRSKSHSSGYSTLGSETATESANIRPAVRFTNDPAGIMDRDYHIKPERNTGDASTTQADRDAVYSATHDWTELTIPVCFTHTLSDFPTIQAHNFYLWQTEGRGITNEDIRTLVEQGKFPDRKEHKRWIKEKLHTREDIERLYPGITHPTFSDAEVDGWGAEFAKRVILMRKRGHQVVLSKDDLDEIKTIMPDPSTVRRYTEKEKAARADREDVSGGRASKDFESIKLASFTLDEAHSHLDIDPERFTDNLLYYQIARDRGTRRAKMTKADTGKQAVLSNTYAGPTSYADLCPFTSKHGLWSRLQAENMALQEDDETIMTRWAQEQISASAISLKFVPSTQEHRAQIQSVIDEYGEDGSKGCIGGNRPDTEDCTCPDTHFVCHMSSKKSSRHWFKRSAVPSPGQKDDTASSRISTDAGRKPRQPKYNWPDRSLPKNPVLDDTSEMQVSASATQADHGVSEASKNSDTVGTSANTVQSGREMSESQPLSTVDAQRRSDEARSEG
jgi:hypothetical protein